MKSDNSNLTYAEFLNLLTSRDNDFLKMFRQELNRASSEVIEPDIASYFWECVPVSRATVNKPFEFVVVNSPELKRVRQNPSPFQEHFNRSWGNDVVSFNSLSGDAVLVSPVPVLGYQYGCDNRDNEMRDYKDIAGFNNDAPQCQFNSLWQEVGNKMVESLNSSSATKWLNTHGLMVNYFHVRIDSRPKYYEHQEYLREDASQNIHERPQITYVNLTALKEQAISEITNELAKSPGVSAFELDPEFHQWKSVIERKTLKEAVEGYKKQVLVAIREAREAKTINQPIRNYPFQDNYNGWTREQFIAEINRLKAENEQLRNNQTLTSSERQDRLQWNQRRLEKLESAMNAVSKPTNELNKPKNSYLTPLLIGGGILAVIGLVGVLIYKKSKQNKNKRK